MDKHPTDRDHGGERHGDDGRGGELDPVAGARRGESTTLVMRGASGVPGAAYDLYDNDEINPWDYLNVVLRRRWTVAAVFAVCVLSALVFSLAATPMYKATALLQIQPGGPNVTDFDSVQDSVTQAQAYNDFFQTQYDILSSRTLARRTIDELRLDQNADFNPALAEPGIFGKAVAWAKSLVPGREDEEARLTARQQEHLLVDEFLDEVEIKPRRKSFLVELSYFSEHPELAQEIADTMAREYIDLTLDQSVDAASQARDFIQKQVAKVKGSLEESEEQLQEFARGHDIHAIEQEETVIHDRLTDLNMRLTEAETERIQLEALYDQAKGPDRDNLAVMVNNPLIKALRENLANAEAERAEQGMRFTDEYPEMQTLEARINGYRLAIMAEQDRVVGSIRSDYEQAQQRESLLREQLENQKNVVADYEEKAVAFKILQREADTTRDIYENLLRRMKEVEVTEAIRASNITLVDAPEVPLDADSPKIPLNMAVSMMLGLVGGIGIAFVQEYMDDTLKTPEDVERNLRLPTLGTIPEFSLPQPAEEKGTPTADLEVVQQPTSAGSEAIRTLRASLFLAAPGGLPTRLLLTSARPGEGKTCIAVNLATALAQMGRRVCLVDCDLRRPRVNKALSMDLSPGLTNYLTGNTPLDEIVRPSGQAGLDIIAAGPIPPNPVDLLDSANMANLLRELEELYDHVLVDAPPALGFADVPIMTNQLGGGCLLVTRSGETSKRMAKQACDYLIRMQSKLLGVVLNRVSTRRAGYSYYGYYGYYGDYYSRREADESLQTIGGANAA
jgi:succinoglycan biosynthesis transport protein ExoP